MIGSLGFADPERENAVLLAIIEATASGPDPESRAAAVAGVITDATATDVCFVHVLDDSEQSLTLLGATPPFDAHVGSVHLPLGHGVSGWVASHEEPVVILEDKEADPRYLPIPALRGQEFTSMVSVPMISPPWGLTGVLNVHTRERHDFDDRDVRLLLAIGRLLAGGVHQARMHRQLAARERAHERFAEQIVAAQETERRRLAREIHDGVSQGLVSLSYHLDAVISHLDRGDPDSARDDIAAACALVDSTYGEARAVSGALRPPVLDDLGLTGALAALVHGTPGGIATFAVSDDVDLPDHVETAIYRIAQETLQNVIKHAAASRITVRLDTDGGDVRLVVADDGIGFTPTATSEDAGDDGGFGLASVRERAELLAGTLHVTTRPGEGTTVTVTAPVPDPLGSRDKAIST
ncbi:GAF domain-containing sensor histidine kinase [Actinomycetospora sp. C-140]